MGGRRRKREGGMEEGGRGDSLRGRVGTSYYLVRVCGRGMKEGPVWPFSREQLPAAPGKKSVHS